jgi:hypothetical protein
MGIPIGLLLALARNEWPSVLSVLRLSLRLNRGVIVKSDTALAATNDDKFASLTDIEVAQNGIESRRMELHKSRIFNGVKKHLAAGNSDPQRRRRIVFQ